LSLAQTELFVIGSEYRLKYVFSKKEVATNFKGFEAFDCVMDSNGYTLICDHFQMAPAASYRGGFRFEKGYLAKGLFYNPIVSGRARFTDDFTTLAIACTHGFKLIALFVTIAGLIM